MLHRFDHDVLEQQPRAVILWGYINDLFRSDRESIEATKARARDSFLEMIRKALENGVEPILATEVTIRPKAGFKEAVAGFVGRLTGKQSYQSYINQHVTELNAWLREQAEVQDLVLLDFEMALAGSDGSRLKKFAQDDGSHISKAGYAALDTYAAPVLSSRLRSVAPPPED
jgi:lysophospholipase L1-like esterase